MSNKVGAIRAGPRASELLHLSQPAVSAHIEARRASERGDSTHDVSPRFTLNIEVNVVPVRFVVVRREQVVEQT